MAAVAHRVALALALGCAASPRQPVSPSAPPPEPEPAPAAKPRPPRVAPPKPPPAPVNVTMSVSLEGGRRVLLIEALVDAPTFLYVVHVDQAGRPSFLPKDRPAPVTGRASIRVPLEGRRGGGEEAVYVLAAGGPLAEAVVLEQIRLARERQGREAVPVYGFVEPHH